MTKQRASKETVADCVRENVHNEKREKLFYVSAEARKMRETAIAKAKSKTEISYNSVVPLNSFIREIYGLKKNTLRTYEEWKKAGYVIKKGEKAFLFWECPIVRKAETDQADTNVTEYLYFPIRYLFTENQVHRYEVVSK